MNRDDVVADGTSPTGLGGLKDALPPVRKSVVVPMATPDAFDLFFRRLPEWWPLSTRSVALEHAASCHVTLVGVYTNAHGMAINTRGVDLSSSMMERVRFLRGIPDSRKIRPRKSK